MSIIDLPASREWGEGTYGGGLYGANYLDPITAIGLEVLMPDGTWRDVTCDLRDVTIDRGRSSWVEAFKAGTMALSMANYAGLYGGWTPNSVWRQPNGSYTDVPIRVRSFRNATARALFTGTTDSVSDTWPGTVDAVANVLATDGFKQLARHNGGPRAAAGNGELTGARITRLANDAAWPAADRAIDVGTVPLAASTLDGVTVDLMRQVGESEWGWLYVRGDGALTFRQRNAQDTDPRMTTVQYIFADTDAISGACYGDLVLMVDSDRIINTASVSAGGAQQSYADAGSVSWYGPRTFTRTDLPILNAADGIGTAQAIVTGQAFDDHRIDSVTFDAVNHPNAWAAAHDVRLLDRIRVVRTFPGGWQVDAELIVQGRKDTITAGGNGRPGSWSITLTTASAALIAGLGAWDEATWDDGIWGV